MRLAESGKLNLDAPIFGILNQYSPYNGKLGDNRLAGITVRQVLHHVGGWDRMVSGDPVTGDRTLDASNATHTSFPPTRDTVIRYMLAQRLDFDPGSRFAYSNFGYMLLGRVIEKISGQAYAAYVRDAVLTPAGLPRIQQGGSTLAARLAGEVKYYDYPGAPMVSSFVSAAREMEPAPYGFANFDLGDADGAWVGSVIDLAKFTAMLDGVRPRAPINAGSFGAMIAQTPRNTWVDSVGWYGFGLFATPQLGGITWSHGGSLPGTRSYFWRFANGICYAFLFNGDSKDQTSLDQLRCAGRMGLASRGDRLAGPRPFPAILCSQRRAGGSGERCVFPAGSDCASFVDDGDRRRSGGQGCRRHDVAAGQRRG